MSAPFFLRLGAIAFDYTIIVICPAIGLLLGRLLGVDGTKLVSSEMNNIAWLIGILIGFCNMLVLPLFTGQSLGKMITGLKIVTLTGRQPGVTAMILRQTVGYLLTFASGGLGFLISVFSSKGRALHDYLTGTVVVHGRSVVRTDR